MSEYLIFIFQLFFLIFFFQHFSIKDHHHNNIQVKAKDGSDLEQARSKQGAVETRSEVVQS